ncbi:MAG: tetratricopeptide repeat protein [Pyrinomonadaceae bacterium]|nr:tetratricopeptide repeat protein [Pyrinomonadaceae bacterium]
MRTRSIQFIVTALVLSVFPLIVSAQIKLTWKVEQFDIASVLPSNYSADRDLDVTAKLRLRNQSERGFGRVTLRINESAKIESVTANGTSVDFRLGTEKLSETQNLQKVQIRVPSVAAGATVEVSVKYKFKVDANSGLNALSPTESQFLPYSYWYPAPTSWFFPEGADRAPVNISVEGVGNRKLVAAGSGVGNKFSAPVSGMPFFATGNWNVTESDGVFVYAPKSKGVVPARIQELAGLAGEAKAYVESLAGKKIDVPIHIVGVSRGSGFSENGTVFVDRGAFMSGSLDSKTAVAITEAVSKAMFGNVVEVRGRAYGVVSEGLSRHVSNRFIEDKFGKETLETIRLRQLSNYQAISDKDGPLSQITPVDVYYYSATGNKGAMIWNYLGQKYEGQFDSILRASLADGELSLTELRSAFSGQKGYLDYSIDQVTGLNLMIGRPLASGAVTKCALRNLGEVPVVVEAVGYEASGKKYSSTITIPAKGFSEVVFQSPSVVRAELDPGKLYTQLSYRDDVAPREITDDDPLVFIKREFDRQRYSEAERNARLVLRRFPAFDDARVFLGRAHLAQGRMTDAKTEFEKVLGSKLPTPQSQAWALVGLGEVARKTGNKQRALEHYQKAIQSDAEYGATLAARRGRKELNVKSEIPSEVTSFFANFDKAVVANSKRAVESLLMKGEIARFSGSVAGQTQAWTTSIIAVDALDDESFLVETDLSLKLLNRNVETGLAVFRLSRVGGELKLSGVEVFEVS